MVYNDLPFESISYLKSKIMKAQRIYNTWLITNEAHFKFNANGICLQIALSRFSFEEKS